MSRSKKAIFAYIENVCIEGTDKKTTNCSNNTSKCVFLVDSVSLANLHMRLILEMLYGKNSTHVTSSSLEKGRSIFVEKKNFVEN